jgi:ornithine carbamoyltransferase
MHQLPWSELEVTRDVMFDEDNLTWTELENRKFAAMVNM